MEINLCPIVDNQNGGARRDVRLTTAHPAARGGIPVLVIDGRAYRSGDLVPTDGFSRTAGELVDRFVTQHGELINSERREFAIRYVCDGWPEHRCLSCDRLLAKGEVVLAWLRCPKCKTVVKLESKKKEKKRLDPHANV